MWQNYAVITNLGAQTEEYRIALFLHCIGPDALRIYNGFDFATEEEQKSLENVIQKFDQYAIGELKETYERFQFNDCNQKPDRKKYSLEFIVVKESLAPLIGARAAQHMQLIMVNADKFVTASNVKSVKETSEVKRLTTVEQLLEEYSDVLNRQLGTLPGKVHLEVDKDVKPVVTPVRRVPTALTAKLKTELDKYVELGVLAPIEERTPWVSSLVVATKKSGALRVCIDPREFNKALKRETYQLPILDKILPELAQAEVFLTVDLLSGFWHCVLDEESSILTTFATPYGRYRWRRLPFGLNVSSEIFQRNVNQALEGLEGMSGEVKLRCKEVTFMGHVFTSNGLKIDPDKVKAIVNMSKPEDIQGFQRLNGFVNYLAKFLPKLSDVMLPIRELTQNDVEWQWSEKQEKAFAEVKRAVTEAPVLRYYDPKKDLEIQCSASQSGLGATQDDWTTRSNMLIADMLSRTYLTEDFKGQAEFEQINMAKFLPITDQRLKEIR
ncbi:hypothetical protein QZH41_019803 [Actinostola sp. cb2023]|nr:hypothetical protein QZH41_019803 [Actinostola sp. cb2023]